MMQLAGARLSIEEACRTARVSRAGFYRHYDEHAPRQAETELRDRIQRVALENRFYGYRRVAAELRRQGVVVNHKRVLRVMREDNLLSLRKRRFMVTTDSRHYRPIYPNLRGGPRNHGAPIRSGSPISPTFTCARSSSFWPWFWTPFRGAWWGGNWARASRRVWPWRP